MTLDRVHISALAEGPSTVYRKIIYGQDIAVEIYKEVQLLILYHPFI